MKKEIAADAQEQIEKADLALLNDLNAALQVEKHNGIFSVVILLFVFVIVFVIWAYNSPLEEVTRG